MSESHPPSPPPLAHLWDVLRSLPQGAKHMLRDTEQTTKRVLYRANLVPPPLKAKFHLTDVCNFRCPTCSKWEEADPPRELETAQWRLALDRLAGVPFLNDVTFSGGEPFTRRDLLDIVGHAKRLGFYVTIITNGWAVAEHLPRLRELGVDQLIVSLNSLREAIHDDSRAMPGSYRRIMSLIETWRQGPARPRMVLETVVMQPNCDELVAMARFVREKGLSGIIFQPLGAVEAHYPFADNAEMPAGEPSWWEKNPLWVRDLDVIRAQCGELLRLRRRGWPIVGRAWHLRRFERYFRHPESIPEIVCVGTLTSLYVDPFGGMRLCCGYGPIGNLLTDDPRVAWRSRAAREIRRQSRDCTRLCRLLNCNL